MRTLKLARIRLLLNKAAKGDIWALEEVRYTTEALMKTGADVIDNWERGDLAGAVNVLREQLDYAEGRKKAP